MALQCRNLSQLKQVRLINEKQQREVSALHIGRKPAASLHVGQAVQQQITCLHGAGTGKSTYINRHLVQGLPKESWAPIFITFSARTTGNMAQEQVCTCLWLQSSRTTIVSIPVCRLVHECICLSKPWGNCSHDRLISRASSQYPRPELTTYTHMFCIVGKCCDSLPDCMYDVHRWMAG